MIELYKDGSFSIDLPYNKGFLDWQKSVKIPKRWTGKTWVYHRDWTSINNIHMFAQKLDEFFSHRIDTPLLKAKLFILGASPVPAMEMETEEFECYYIGAIKAGVAYAHTEKRIFNSKVVLSEKAIKAWLGLGDGQTWNPYSILGIPLQERNLPIAQLKGYYHLAAKSTHPDINPGKDDAEFKAIQEAWETLNKKRAKVDGALFLEKRIKESTSFDRSSDEVTIKEDDLITTEWGVSLPKKCGILTVYGHWAMDQFHVEELISWKDIFRVKGFYKEYLVTYYKNDKKNPIGFQWERMDW